MAETLLVITRVSRKIRRCERCRHAILPGEPYEDQRMPPWQEFNDTPHWRRLVSHVGAYPNGVGCDEAQAYEEKAERERPDATFIISDEDTIVARDSHFGTGLDTWRF